MYKTRQTFEQIISLSPNEDIEVIKQLFEEAATYGLNFFQWSSFSQPLNKTGNRENLRSLYPDYDTATNEQKRKWRDEFTQNEPNHYFIEAFGYQYIRVTGETFLEMAKDILEIVKQMHDCMLHEWAYTHSNGHKTCSLCGFFTSCTVEEALQNYQKGEVKLTEHETLYFDHEKALCSCGSHQIVYLRKSYFPEKTYRCSDCRSLLPNEKETYGYFPTTTIEKIKEDFAFYDNTSVTYEQFREKFNSWLTEVHEHYLYIEDKTVPFLDWVQPYIHQLTEVANLYIVGKGITSRIESLSLSIHEIQEDGAYLHLSIKQSDEKATIPTKEEAFHNALDSIVKSLKD